MAESTIENQTNFSCQICDKKFADKSNYNQHVRTHREELVECKYCPKTFVTEKQCEYHTRTHTKLYECKHCQKKILTRYLETHEMNCKDKNKTTSVPNPEGQSCDSDAYKICKYCDTPFVYEFELEMHLLCCIKKREKDKIIVNDAQSYLNLQSHPQPCTRESQSESEMKLSHANTQNVPSKMSDEETNISLDSHEFKPEDITNAQNETQSSSDMLKPNHIDPTTGILMEFLTC